MNRLAILVLATGCFNPSFSNGVPCSADRECPRGQICAEDDRCYDPDSIPDFDDAAVDAPPDVLRVVEIAGGGPASMFGHTCAVFSDGGLRCFGSNTFGQLGQGNTVAFGDNEPANSAPLVDVASVQSVGLGFDSTCAVFEDGQLQCWGDNAHGELGQGTSDVQPIGDDEEPNTVPAIELGGPAAEVCGSDSYTCARLENGQVKCFGLETNTGSGGSALGLPGVSQIGLDDKPSQFAAIDLGDTAIDIDCGFLHVCAVTNARSVLCWGVSSTGALGYPGRTGSGFDEPPKDVGTVDVSGSVDQVALGENHTCALLSSGSVRCWGLAESLGIGSDVDIGDNEPPSAVDPVDLGRPAVEIKANGKMTCARLDNGDVRCWGFPNGHSASPVGDNEPPSSFTPLPLPAPAVGLGVGYRHACAILETHEVYCWGDGDGGRLGYGDEEDVGIGSSVISKGPVPIL